MKFLSTLSDSITDFEKARKSAWSELILTLRCLSAIVEPKPSISIGF